MKSITSFDDSNNLHSGGNDVVQSCFNISILSLYSLSSLATSATGGFLRLPSCAGPPTGNPGTINGTSALAYDTTNNLLNVYNNGGWNQMGKTGSFNNLNVTNGVITNLTGSNATFINVNAGTGLFVNITGTNLTSSTINVTNLFLPTSGGTPSSLNYYEEYSFSDTFNIGLTVVKTSASITIDIVRVGKQVTIHIPGFLFSSAGYTTTSSNLYQTGIIPTRFLPIRVNNNNTSCYYMCVCTNNSGTASGTCYLVYNGSTGYNLNIALWSPGNSMALNTSTVTTFSNNVGLYTDAFITYITS